MIESGADFWANDTSVLFTSFWGWRPETWATVGWTHEKGRAYRENLLTKLTDPFITVIYVTRDPDKRDLELVGKIVGFYLMSHEKGHRNEFTHPWHWKRYPEKWQYSLRALRAFSFLADPPLIAKEFEPRLSSGSGQAIASWGKILTDPAQIELLRNTPWREEPIYRADVPADVFDEPVSGAGMVKAGPLASQPYTVSPNAALLGWRLYLLRLDGDTDAFLDRAAGGRSIYKIGLSVSPDARRRSLQKSMPLGAFRWRTERTSKAGPNGQRYTFEAAVAGEMAMKRYLAEHAEWLSGEFYLASRNQIDEAWRIGHDAADQFSGKQ